MNWLRNQVSSDTLAADIPRMSLALVVALLTRYVLDFILTNLTSWFDEEALSQPAALFVTYFLFCLYYFLFCQMAFGRLKSAELQQSLKRTRPRSGSGLMAFIMGESGTSHATMFSIVALVGVGAISFNVDSGNDATETLFLQVTGLLAVVGSWISNAASFALQYARDDADEGKSDFRYPDEIQPTWSDYLYTAIMVSATLSTADVDVMSKQRRRMVSIHTIIAFAFNTVIIALLVATLV